jgi:hypothetical protein
MEQDVRVAVDFNAGRADGSITASARFARIIPDSGAWVVLYDPEGNECAAIVESVDQGAIRCRPDWRSWRSAGQVRFPQHTHPVRFAGVASAVAS